jgi:hypothetical protein
MSHLRHTGVSTLALEYKGLSASIIKYELDRLIQGAESMKASGPAPMPTATRWEFSDTSSIPAQGMGESTQYTNDATPYQDYMNDEMTQLNWGSVDGQDISFQ